MTPKIIGEKLKRILRCVLSAKQNKKELTLIYAPRWDMEYFGKDNFLVPYHLGKMLDCHVTIVYPHTHTHTHTHTQRRLSCGIERGNSDTYCRKEILF